MTPQRPPRTVALGALLVTLGSTGCSSDPVRTEIAITRSRTTPCRSTVEGTVRTMNAYMVEVYVIPNPGDDPPSCFECATGSKACALLAQRCTCGDGQQTTVENLTTALSGMHFAVEREVSHCVRILGLELEASVRDACECPLPIEPSMEVPLPEGDAEPVPPPENDGGPEVPRLPDGGPEEPPLPDPERHHVRACALSNDPSPAGATTLTLDLTCLDDAPGPAGGPADMACVQSLPLPF